MNAPSIVKWHLLDPLFSMNQDPATAIPKGTLGAIFLTTLSYLGICITIGGFREKKPTFTFETRRRTFEFLRPPQLTSVLSLKAPWSSVTRRGT